MATNFNAPTQGQQPTPLAMDSTSLMEMSPQDLHERYIAISADMRETLFRREFELRLHLLGAQTNELWRDSAEVIANPRGFAYPRVANMPHGLPLPAPKRIPGENDVVESIEPHDPIDTDSDYQAIGSGLDSDPKMGITTPGALPEPLRLQYLFGNLMWADALKKLGKAIDASDDYEASSLFDGSVGDVEMEMDSDPTNPPIDASASNDSMEINDFLRAQWLLGTDLVDKMDDSEIDEIVDEMLFGQELPEPTEEDIYEEWRWTNELWNV